MNRTRLFTTLNWHNWLVWLKQWLTSDRGRLTQIWFGRFILLWLITFRFADNQPLDNASHLPYVRALLLIFWAYVIIAGIAGVYHFQWQLLPRIKRLQVAIELCLFSSFLYLSQDPNSAIYYAYFFPLLVAADYLTLQWAIMMWLLALAGYGGAVALIPGSLDLSNFWPRAVFMTAIFIFFLLTLGRRRSVLEDAVTEKAEVMAILKQYDDGVYVIDGSQRLRYVNETLKARHGRYRPGQPCYHYFQCREDLCNWCPPNAERHQDFSQVTKNEGLFEDRDGHPYQVETIAYPLAMDDDQGTGAIVFVRNIEDRRKLEQHLQRLIRQQTRWRDTYDAMGKRLAGFSQLDEMMQFLVNETMKRLDAETSALFLLEKDRLVRQAIAGLEPEWFPDETYYVGQGITGKAVQPAPGERYAKPRRVNNVDADSEVVQPHLALYQSKLPSGVVKHLIAVPLNGHTHTFGVLRVVNKLTSRGHVSADGFAQEDVDFMVTLASMVALAIENTRQLQQISTLYNVSRRITQTLDLNQVLDAILAEVTRISDGNKTTIHLIDQHSQTLVRRATNNPSGYSSGQPLIGVGQGVAGRAIRERQPVYVPDTRVDPDFLPRGGARLLSLLVIPLLAGKRVLGTLSVNSSRTDAFSADQRHQLIALATQAALAIEKAQLYQKTRALHHVSNLVNSNLKRNEIFGQVLPELQQVVAFDSISVQLLVGNQLELIHAWGFDDNAAVNQLVFPANDSKFPNFEVLRTKQPVIIDDVRHQYPHFADEKDFYHSQNIRNWLGVPLMRENEVIGMVALDKKTPDYYTQADADLALTFANHLAIAIENTSLYEEAARQAQMLTGLVEASQGLITHTTLDELYRFCAVKGAEIFNVEDCSLTVLDVKRRVLNLVASTCLPADVCAQAGAQLDAPGLRAYVAKSGETLNFGGDEHKQHPAWSGKFVDHLNYLPSRKCHSLLMGPLVDSRGRNVGVLRMENKRGDYPGERFTDFEVALHKMFASHIGTAIERAHLFSRLNAEARQKARESLSHDLHDTASFVHGALVLRTAAARSLLEANQMADLVCQLDHLHKAARHTYNSIRRLHQDTRDPALQQKGLLLALEQWASMLPLPNTDFISKGKHALPPDIEYGLYKIGQEALSNVAQHVKTDSATQVRLETTRESYRLIIEDNGDGFEVEKIRLQESSFGIQSIERWAIAIEAKLEIDSQPARGTQIRVTGHLSKEKKNEQSN